MEEAGGGGEVVEEGRGRKQKGATRLGATTKIMPFLHQDSASLSY